MTGAPEPTSREIAREWLTFAGLLLAVGIVIVALRVWKDGPQVLTFAPHKPYLVDRAQEDR
ncbi:MAG: hypothetical protein HMLKMBBP_01998 [Planctomycetes bacterium]|nr:hypothetical protein [Planctomycetota bacterium]